MALFFAETTSGSSPGPVYAVNASTVEKKTPSYSFGGPFKHNYKSEGPGPNTYNVLKPWGSENKGPLISGRTKDSKVLTLICLASTLYRA